MLYEGYDSSAADLMHLPLPTTTALVVQCLSASHLSLARYASTLVCACPQACGELLRKLSKQSQCSSMISQT